MAFDEVWPPKHPRMWLLEYWLHRVFFSKSMVFVKNQDAKKCSRCGFQVTGLQMATRGRLY